MESTVPENEMQPIVYCNDLSSETTSVELISLFSPVAPVLKISLRRRGDMKTSYAFVTFLSVNDALKIVEKFHFYTLHNKQMLLSIYNKEQKFPEEANIFVKNLPSKLNSKDLYEIFKMFGSIASCKVATHENGESKGFGFVQYKNIKSAKKAISSCQNAKIGNNALEVMPYDKQLKVEKAESDKTEVAFTNVYVKNFPSTLTEERLRTILEKYGPINSFYFPLDKEYKPVGYACANYTNSSDALAAIEALHEKLTFDLSEYSDDNVLVAPPFYIQRAEKKKDREESLRKQFDLLSLEGSHSKKNLYISNIPDSFSKEEIKSIFEKFGTVTNLKVEKTSPTSNFQYGYVCFSTPVEAALAHEKVGNMCLDQNKLQISFYKNKLERLSEDEPVRMSPMNGFSGDRSRSGTSSKLFPTILSMIENSASLYKSDWSLFDSKNVSDFSQKISKNFLSLQESDLKSMISDSKLLDAKIKKIINLKKDKVKNAEKLE